MTGNFTSNEHHQSAGQVRLNEKDAPLTRKEEFHLPLFALQANATEQSSSAIKCLAYLI
jgi:hypothetical protein